MTFIQEINENMEYEPLLIETLAFDLASSDYGMQEDVFRFATHKYELQKDPDIRECLDDYLSN